MFTTAISNLAGAHHGPINEQAAVDAHQQVFGGSPSNLAAGTIGTAAAMQALKSFLGKQGTQAPVPPTPNYTITSQLYNVC